MASIDNLNFAVILDDKNFRKQIEADLKLAKDFNIQLSDAFDLRRSGMGDAPKLLRQYQQRLDALMKSGKKLTEEQRQERENLKQLIRLYQRQVINISNAEARQQRYARTVRETTSEMDRQSRYLSQMTNMIKTATSAYAAKEIISDMIRITGEFEMQRVALRSILQDMTGADMLYEKIQALAVESPFQFKELISYTKQLAAFSVPLDELYDTTKMLADVSSGLGVGMDRLILAYGQIRSAAFLRGTEVRQLTEAGVPILEELRQKFEELGEEGVTVGDVFDKISARMVPFEMVKEVFEDMTSAGGMFYQMQEVQAQTLAGKISNLKDAYEVMFAEIGGKNETFLKNSVDLVRRLMQNYERLGEIIKVLIGTYGALRVVMSLVAITTKGVSVAFSGLISVSKKLWAVLMANPYTALAAGLAAVATTIYTVSTRMSQSEKLMQNVNDAYRDYNAELSSSQHLAKYLIDRMKELEVGSEKYESIQSELLRNYRELLTEEDKAAISAGNLTQVYENLAVALEKVNRQKHYQEGEADITEDYEAEYDSIIRKMERLFRRNDINDAGLQRMILDFITKEEGYTESSLRNITAQIVRVVGGSQEEMLANFDKIERKVKNLSDRFTELSKNTNIARKELRKYLGFEPDDKKTDQVNLAPWQEAVNNYIEADKYVQSIFKKPENYQWWSNDKKNNDYWKYVDDIRSAWKSVGEQIEDVGNYIDAKPLEEERRILEDIAKLLGISISDEDSGGRISDLVQKWRIQVQWLQELQKQYQALSQYADNATLSPLFMGRYGEDINSILSFLPEERRMSILVDFDFEDNLLYMASEIRKVGTDAALALAEQIERSVGGDWASVQEGLFKAVRDYADFIKEWGGQDFMLDGKGVVFDLSKIAADYNNAISKVAKTRDEAIKKAAEAAKKNGTEWYVQQLAYITALYGKQMDYEKKLRQEKVRELGSAYAKELIEANPAILTEDFSDASFRQIRDSLSAIDELMEQVESNDLIPEETKQRLSEAGLSLDDFRVAMDKYIDDVEKKNLSELAEKVVDAATTALSTITDLGGSIAQLGNEIDDADLERLGEALQKASQYASSILQGFAQGGLVGGLIALVTSFIDALISGISKSIEYQQRLNEAAKEYQRTIRELAREDYDTIFGTDELGRFMNDLKEASKFVDKYNESLKKAQESRYIDNGKGAWTKKHSTISTLATVSSLSESDFYNNGTLDMEKVKAYFEQVGDEIPKKQRKVLEELIENYDYMNEQMGYMDEYLSSLFGNLASDIADAWMESWKNMADTAEDEAERMKDVFYDLGEAIVQSMVQSLIINTVLEKYTDQLKQLYTQYETSQNINAFNEGLSSIFSNMKEDLEDLQPVIEDIYDNAEANDIINRDDYNSIDTIQGNLSEETMNRVLNIVNAMWAEQFRQGMRIDNIDVTLVSIAGLLGESRDQYLNYLAQISANTANTAERMQQWLDTWGDATSGSGPSGSLRVRIVN